MEPQSLISPELVQMARRSRFNPIRSLTPEMLSLHLDSFQSGLLSSFAIDAEAIKQRDDVICVALPKREKAVSRRGYVVHTTDGLDESLKDRASEHQAALKYFYDNLTAVNALDQNERGGFRRLVRQMMEAVGFRYAVHEIVWQPRIVDGQPRLTAQFNYVPLQFFENTTGRLRFVKDYFGINGQDMPDEQWLVTVGDGIMQALSVAWMFKQLSLKDWVSFNELLGTPIRLGKTNAAKDSPAWTILEEALAAIGQDFAAVVSDGSSIEFIDGAKGAGTSTFAPLVERMDRAIATICRGADLSTMSAGQGSGQGASLQGDESDLLEQDDAEMISETLLAVSRIVIRQLFGDETPLAFVQVVVPKKKNNEDTRKNVELLGSRGVAIGQDWARNEFGIPKPGESEEVLTTPAAPALPFTGPIAGPEFAALANAAEAAFKEQQFRRNALRSVVAAKAKAFAPIVARLEQIAGMDDATSQDAALVKLKSDLPKYAKDLGATEAEISAWVEAMAAKIVSGAAEAAKTKSSK